MTKISHANKGQFISKQGSLSSSLFFLVVWSPSPVQNFSILCHNDQPPCMFELPSCTFSWTSEKCCPKKKAAVEFDLRHDELNINTLYENWCLIIPHSPCFSCFLLELDDFIKVIPYSCCVISVKITVVTPANNPLLVFPNVGATRCSSGRSGISAFWGYEGDLWRG